MSNPISNRVGTFFVHVTDLERSVRWYSALLGLEVKETEFTGPIYTLDMGQGRPGLTLDNHCLDDDYELKPSNQPLFNLSTPDIHEAFEHVRDFGADLVTEIETFPDVADFSFKDPDGNIIMVCQVFESCSQAEEIKKGGNESNGRLV